VVCAIQKRRNERWRSSSFWAPVNKSYRWECWKNSRKNQRGSSVHNWRDLRTTGVSWSSCQWILTVDLNMRRVAAKLVSRLLTQDQKNTRLTLCQELKNQTESDPNFLSKVITGDESWCYGYDPETKQASSQWKTPNSPRPKKARQVRSNVKRCSLFFRCLRNRAPGICSSWTDCQSGILLGGFEANEIECAKKTPRIVDIGWLVSPSLQRPSSHSFVCDLVFGLSGMDCHSPLSLFTGPSPLWFLFIPDNKKKTLKGKRSATVEEVQTASQEAPNNIKLQQFQRCFTQWEKRLDKCIASNGEYFDGD